MRINRPQALILSALLHIGVFGAGMMILRLRCDATGRSC